MNFSLKLLVSLTVIGSFIGNSFTHPIDDLEGISTFKIANAVRRESLLEFLAKQESLTKDAIDDASISTGTRNQQNTMITMVDSTDEQTSDVMEDTVTEELENTMVESTSEQPLIEINEPDTTMETSEKQNMPDMGGEESKTKGDSLQLENSDTTKAKTMKRNADNEGEEEPKWEAATFNFRQSSHNGQITERVFEKETKSSDSSKDTDSDSDIDSHFDTDSNSDSDSHFESDSDSDSDSSNSKDSNANVRSRYMVKRSSESNTTGTYIDDSNNTMEKTEKKVKSSTIDEPYKDDHEDKNSNPYDAKSEMATSNDDNTYYEGESLNFYTNSENARDGEVLEPSYDEEYPLGVSVDGNDDTDDYRRAKSSGDRIVNVLSINKKLDEESTKFPIEVNNYAKDWNATSQSEYSLATDKPDFDETMKLIKDTEVINYDYENHQPERPLLETIIKIPTYNDDHYRVKRNNVFALIVKKKVENEDATEVPMEENDDMLTSAKEPLDMEISQDNHQLLFNDSSRDSLSFADNYYQGQQANVLVLVVKKKSEKEDMTEAPIQEDNNANEEEMNETTIGDESQSTDKPEQEETTTIKSDLQLSNLDYDRNQHENSLPAISYRIDYDSDDNNSRVKRNNDLKEKILEIKMKKESEDLGQQPTIGADNQYAIGTSETEQKDELLEFDEANGDNLPVSANDDKPFSTDNDESLQEHSSLDNSLNTTYSDNYGRVSHNDEWDSSNFRIKNAESDVQSELPMEGNYDQNDQYIVSDAIRKDNPQFMNEQS